MRSMPLVKRRFEGKGHGHLLRQPLRQMTGHPKLGRFGLLMDLLEHEVAEFTLVRHVIRAGEQGWHPLLTLPCAS